MRAVSLWEPWASAIAIGAKQIETRSWPTNYRGPLAIHAAKTRDWWEVIHEPSVAPAFVAAGIRSDEQLAFGCVVATCELVRCVPTKELRCTISPLEEALGGYDDGRYGWVLENIVRLPKPIPARGSQGFWDWQPNTSANAIEDADDLLVKWLACSEQMLALASVSHTQLETCVIGLQKWCGGKVLGREEIDERAVAMAQRLKDAQKTRAWKAEWPAR